MNFRKSSERGGVISNPKIFIANFGLLNRVFFGIKMIQRGIFRVCFFFNNLKRNLKKKKKKEEENEKEFELEEKDDVDNGDKEEEGGKEEEADEAQDGGRPPFCNCNQFTCECSPHSCNDIFAES